MADLNKKQTEDIQPDIRPDLHSIKGGGQTTPDRANLRELNAQEENIEDRSPGSVPTQEENPDFINNVKGTHENKAAKITLTNLRALFKRKGPSGFIIGIVLAGGLGGLALGGLGLLPFHIIHNLVSKFDTQNTSFTIRTNKIISNKLSKELTAGCSTPVKIVCRYSKPSNKLLKNFAKNGITAYDKAGRKIEPQKGLKALFPDVRPDSYSYNKTPNGPQTKPISAKEFAAKIRADSSLRSAVFKSYNPLFARYSNLNSAVKANKIKFGYDGRNTTDATTNKTPKERVNIKATGPDVGAKAAAGELGNGAKSGAQSLIKKLITDKAVKIFSKIALAGKGSAVTLVAASVCALGDVPGIIASTARSFQLTQLIRYGAAISNIIYAMMAGDGTQEDGEYINNLFTEEVNGESAMSAFGMQYGLFGDTTPKDDDYKKFVPGGGVITELKDVTQVTNSEVKEVVCDIAVDPATGAVVNASLVAAGGATVGTSILAGLINYGIGVALSKVITTVLPGVIKFTTDLIPDEWLQSILGFFLGDLTQNLVGKPVGNAFPSAVAHGLGQTANTGGNMAMSVPQAVKYSKLTKEVQLAQAEEDRATLSPFDASNPNTFLGSVLNQFLPYYAKLSSVSGTLSTIGSIIPQSFSTLLKPYTASALDATSEYTMCDDPALKNVAAGPFCNPIYGIPPEYLDKDPQDILNNLISSGDIDEDTGEPIKHDEGGDIEHLDGWLALCADGTTDNIDSCVITDERKAEFAIYTIDHIIQKSMDEEEDPILTSSSSSTTPAVSADSLNVVVNKQHSLDPIDYAPTNLVNVGDKWTLRSEAAVAFKSMQYNAANTAGITLTAVSAYRDYALQTEVYNEHVNNLGQAGADATSARPGHSEHQTGLAVDINVTDGASFADTDAGKWLANNSWQYGFVLRYPSGKTAITGYEFEPWHYRFITVKDATDMHDKGISTLEEYYNVTGGEVYAYAPPTTLQSQLLTSSVGVTRFIWVG